VYVVLVSCPAAAALHSLFWFPSLDFDNTCLPLAS
jgi:hypothetical protein